MEHTTINMPLLGDPFPELAVQTTHGPMNIPGDFKGADDLLPVIDRKSRVDCLDFPPAGIEILLVTLLYRLAGFHDGMQRAGRGSNGRQHVKQAASQNFLLV